MATPENLIFAKSVGAARLLTTTDEVQP